MALEGDLRLRIGEPGDCINVARLHHLSHTISFAEFAEGSWLAERQLADYIEYWCEYLEQQPANERTWLVEQRAKVVGTLTIMSAANSSEIFIPSSADPVEKASIACLRLMYVHPQHLRQGIGRALVNRAEEFVVAQGYREVSLITHAANERARAFYESLGWQLDEVFNLQVEEFFDDPPSMRQRARYIRFFD